MYILYILKSKGHCTLLVVWFDAAFLSICKHKGVVTPLFEYQFPCLPILIGIHILNIWVTVTSDVRERVCLPHGCPHLLLWLSIIKYAIISEFSPLNSVWLPQSHRATVHWHSKMRDEIVPVAWISIRRHPALLDFPSIPCAQPCLPRTGKTADLFFSIAGR